MKRFFQFAAALALVMAIVCTGGWKVEAASKAFTTVELNLRQSYSYDLNKDGKKEKLTFQKSTSETNGVKTYTLTVLINGKKKLTISDKAENRCKPYVYLVDVNTSDKYRELVIDFHQADDAFLSGQAYRYKGGKLNLLFKTKPNRVTYSATTGNQKGDGTFCYKTAYQDSYVGNLRVNRYYTIQNQALTLKGTGTYSVIKAHAERKYQSLMDLKAFKNRSDKKAAFTIKTKATFYITKIRTTNQFAIDWFYVKTKSGKTGWVKNPKKIFYKRYDSVEQKFVNGIYAWD